MKKELYNVDGVVETYYDSELNSVVCTWQQFKNEHVRPCIAEQLKAAQKNSAKCVVVDSAEANGVPSAEDQKWFAEVLFPQMKQAGVKAIITTVGEAAINRISTKTYSKSGELAGLDMVDAADLKAAFEAIKEY
jgi:hypothetical protein